MKEGMFDLLNDIDAKLTRNGIAVDMVGYDEDRDEIYVTLEKKETLGIHRLVDFIMIGVFGMVNTVPYGYNHRYPAEKQRRTQ